MYVYFLPKHTCPLPWSKSCYIWGLSRFSGQSAHLWWGEVPQTSCSQPSLPLELPGNLEIPVRRLHAIKSEPWGRWGGVKLQDHLDMKSSQRTRGVSFCCTLCPLFPLIVRNNVLFSILFAMHDNKTITSVKKMHISWDRDERTERGSGRSWFNPFSQALTWTG